MALGNNITTTNRQAVNSAITSVERPYEVYSVFIEQAGTAAPVATYTFENTLSVTPVWSRITDGEYNFTYTGYFDKTKTFILFTNETASTVVTQVSATNNFVLIQTTDGVGMDDLLGGHLEIRVYK